MSLLLFIIVVGGLIWLVKRSLQNAALAKAARESFISQHAGWDVYIGPFNQAVVAINHDSRSIVLGTIPKHKQYAWSSIASVDVIRDGTSVTSTNRGSQLMGAAVGEVLLGPVGLLIGGVTGSKRTVQRVSQIGLKIIVDDRATPIYVIDFLRVPSAGADPRHKLVQSAAQRTEHLHALLFNAIRNSSVQLASSPLRLSEPSVADRIDQLWKLKEAGALSAGEYEDQKALILRSNNLQSAR